MTAEVVVAGERLILRADRSLYWPRTGSLVVTDLHFGKADAFRARGVPVPGGPQGALDRLTAALAETAARRLVILGDFWHDRIGVTEKLLQTLAEWRSSHLALSVEMVVGNHDRVEPPPDWGAWCDRLVEPPFVMTHYPNRTPEHYVLSGHIHPGVRLGGRGRERLVLPCFRFGDRVGLLPAFGEMTGLHAMRPRRGEKLYAIAGPQVIEVS